MENLQELKQVLLDAIFANPSTAFPQFNWQPNSTAVGRYGAWTSSVHVNGRESTDHNKRQTYIKDGRTDKHAMIADENGESVEILKLWEQDHGERWPNCPDLFRLYGIEPPQRDTEQAAKEEKRKTDTEQLLADIRADYMGTAGAQVRAYLSAPIEQGGRGYDAATVAAMADYFGVITPQTAKRLSDLSGLNIPDNVAERWPLVIPTIAKRGGAIQYAKFRTIDPNATGGAKWHNPAKGATGTGRDDVDPYNYNHTSFLSATGSRTVVIVESEICAAHATAAGIRNVIALRGSDGIKPHVARRLVADGCQRVVVMMDDDEKGRQATKKAINDVWHHAPKLSARVAMLTTAKDPDELLSRHPDDGAAQLQRLIDNAEPATTWIAGQYAIQYNHADNPDERETIERDMLAQVASLKADGELMIADKLTKDFCEFADVKFTAESMAKMAQAQAQARATEQYEKRYQRTVDELTAAVNQKDKQAMADAAAILSGMKPPKDDPELVLPARSYKDAFAELYRDAAKDLKTNYTMYTHRPTGGVSEIPVRLYANGITYFAGGTSHGKSTVLQNIAYDLLTQGKRVLYYGFEETKRDTLLEFINIYVHHHTRNQFGNLSEDGSADAINRFFNTDNPAAFDNLSAIPQAAGMQTEQERAAELVRSFFKEYRGTDDGEKLLYVYDDALTSAELVDHVTEKAAAIRPDAIFIDYVQFLTSEPDNPKAAQWEDLGRVSKDLITINKSEGVPVVVAAQLKEKNNEKVSPFDLRYTDIFGASSIAQGAAAVYLIGNATKYPKDCRVDYFGTDTQFGQSGKMAWKLDKNRFGPCPAYALYQYDGAKRFIDHNGVDNPTNNKAKNPFEN